MRRRLFVAGAVFALLLVLFSGWLVSRTGADPVPNLQADKGQIKELLPIKQVVLFNSGVGYFQRQGEVEGNQRIELSFPTSDINDLLKSLILQDLNGGAVSSVNFDSHDPVDKILRSFALDLNNNPTFGDILNQARGEEIELTLLDKEAKQPAKLTGVIVGMESRQQTQFGVEVSNVESEFLNIDGQKGMQSVPLGKIQAVRFVNPVLDREFKRALQVLATTHDVQKKTVSVGFSGAGKRQVRVGYVVERPIWKTTYRLRLEPNGKLFLQGWAIVENPSDEDWNDTRMVLVSGKPISFKMDLYEPLYIPRPTVELEHFASLRPPLYDAALAMGQAGEPFAQGQKAPGVGNFGMMGMAGNIGVAGFGGFGGQLGGQLGNMGFGGLNIGQFGQLGGQFWNGGQLGQLGQFGQFGQLGQNFTPLNRYQMQSQQQALQQALQQQNRLTYEELQKRRQALREAREQAAKDGSAIAGLNFKEGITSVATADEVGDYYQYIIDEVVNLPRRKSAMLPIINQTIDGIKVSIFNQSVHAKFPLLGLRLKNTSGVPLTQGPITVYDDGTYAGDTRTFDLQPGESRLISYALDQSTEIKTASKTAQTPEITVKIGNDVLTASYKLRQTQTYIIRNRSMHERKLVIEHPIRSDWTLVDPAKPAEKTRAVYRFNVLAPSQETVKFEVVEEQAQTQQVALTAVNDGRRRFLLGEGLEIEPVSTIAMGDEMRLRLDKNLLHARFNVKETRTYIVNNSAERERIVTVDHLVRPGWTQVGGQADGSAKVVRFTLKVPTGKQVQHDVIEEQTRTEHIGLTGREDRPPCYMIGLGIEVETVVKATPARLAELKITDGMLRPRYTVREAITYFVKNNSDRERRFYFSHMVRPEWKLLDAPVLEGPSFFNFDLKTAAGNTASQELVEEKTYAGNVASLKEASEKAIREYLADPAVTARAKAALQNMLELSHKLAQTEKQLSDTEREHGALAQDQTRLRENLKIIPPTAEPYKEFLQKFVEQERRIDVLQRQSRELRASVERQVQDIDAFAAKVQVE
jgi:hypothetical protein